ncbi:MAG: hypothetical protein WCF18_12035 [Chthoniobacteraceae bacterium]
MDFVFYCTSCGGPLIARHDLRGFRVQCAHCSGGIEVRSEKPITEAVSNALLDAPVPSPAHGTQILRRVRPAVRHSSAGASHDRRQFQRGARISFRNEH